MNIIDEEYINYCKNIIISFYKNLNGTSFKNINDSKILELYKNSANILNPENISSHKLINYTKTMKKIDTNQEVYNVCSEAEKFILFMFAVDPNFEAAKIYGECNYIKEIKAKMVQYFGIFDRKLIIIENFFIKHFLSKEKRNEINEEIEKRVYR